MVSIHASFQSLPPQTLISFVHSKLLPFTYNLLTQCAKNAITKLSNCNGVPCSQWDNCLRALIHLKLFLVLWIVALSVSRSKLYTGENSHWSSRGYHRYQLHTLLSDVFLNKNPKQNDYLPRIKECCLSVNQCICTIRRQGLDVRYFLQKRNPKMWKLN